MSPFYKTPLDKNGDYDSPRLHLNDIHEAKDLYSGSKLFEMDRSKGCSGRDCDRGSTPSPRGSKGCFRQIGSSYRLSRSENRLLNPDK